MSPTAARTRKPCSSSALASTSPSAVPAPRAHHGGCLQRLFSTRSSKTSRDERAQLPEVVAVNFFHDGEHRDLALALVDRVEHVGLGHPHRELHHRPLAPEARVHVGVNLRFDDLLRRQQHQLLVVADQRRCPLRDLGNRDAPSARRRQRDLLDHCRPGKDPLAWRELSRGLQGLNPARAGHRCRCRTPKAARKLLAPQADPFAEASAAPPARRAEPSPPPPWAR